MTLFFIFIFQNHAHAKQITRIEGETRYETAVEISKQAFPNGTSTVVLVTGEDFPDALAGAPLAFKLNAPILSTRKDRLPDVTKNEISRLGATDVIILGGTGAISTNVENELTALHLSIRRIAGKNRYETAAEIAKNISSSKAIVANGQNFPDALTVAPYAAKQQIPILLTRERVLPPETKLQLRNETIVVGGQQAVHDSIAKTFPKLTRLSGATRYETNLKIVDFFDKNVEQAFFTTGTNFADALTGSILAAKNDEPIFLSKPDSIPIKTQIFIKQLNTNSFHIIGGTGAISKNAAQSLTRLEDLHVFTPISNSQFMDSNHSNFIAGMLQKGQIYLASKRDQNTHHFNYGNSIGTIDTSKTKNSFTVNEIINSDLAIQSNSNKTILVNRNVRVLDEANQVISTIYAGQRLPIVSENRRSFIVNIAGRKGYLAKNNVEVDNGIPILMYHHILQDKENKKYRNTTTTIADTEFNEQMAFLHRNGYTTITLEDLELFLLKKKNLPSKAVVITFDDGLKSVYRYAYPTLKKYNMSATLFMITGRMPDSPTPFNPDGLQYLSWQELNNMNDVFQYHSHTHAMHEKHNGQGLLLVKSKTAVKNDLLTSQKILKDSPYFSYPFGHYNQGTIALLKET